MFNYKKPVMNMPLKPTALPQDHPMLSRQTLQQLHNVEGEIVQLGPANFGIRTASLNSALLPLNLPDDFQKEGLHVLFIVKGRSPNSAFILSIHYLY
ncbi:MAG: hypothetical protein EOO68_25395 [Moraxellaceae bacterium]|nr:MAG: hypothetical protein EOO68_25395 [Moraxellaceae bacterium]